MDGCPPPGLYLPLIAVVVVSTITSHTEGPGFKSGWKQVAQLLLPAPETPSKSNFDCGRQITITLTAQLFKYQANYGILLLSKEMLDIKNFKLQRKQIKLNNTSYIKYVIYYYHISII